jgi:6-phosphogluconate dehydrogenase
MHLGMIGLGRMGRAMVERLVRNQHQVVTYDQDEEAIEATERSGAQGARSVEAVVAALPKPRILWVMVPAGSPTDQVIESLSARLASGDIIIDGGNSNYKDSMRHASNLTAQGIHFLDVGTSGGIWGLTEGYGMMIGGDPDVIESLRPIFETLAPAPDKGWGRVGPNGAGHFVKMIHNGIEYGIMQAFAEGFELMQHKTEFELDLPHVAEIWQGSVIRSWLLGMIGKTLHENPTLEDIVPYVSDLGTGRWTVAEAIDAGCAIPVISLAVQWRFRSRTPEPFGDKLLAALRNQVGGHAVKRKAK